MITADFCESNCKLETRSLEQMRADTPEGQARSLLKQVRLDFDVYKALIKGQKPFDQVRRTKAYLLPHHLLAIETPDFYWVTGAEKSFLARWRATVNGSRRHLWKKP